MPTYNCCGLPFFLLWLQEASPNPGNPSAMELRIPHAKAASQYHDEHWNHCFCLQAKAPVQNCFPPDFFLCKNLCFLLAVLFDTKQQCIRLHIRTFKWKLKLRHLLVVFSCPINMLPWPHCPHQHFWSIHRYQQFPFTIIVIFFVFVLHIN